jgi:methionyl-tRNA formyltransferase
VKVKTGNLHEWLAEREPDVAVVLAYGRILPPAVLAAPRRGCMNLHLSLLPALRGAAPINWAIANGEERTGVSLMQMDEGLDTGPVFAQRELDIGAEETAGELAQRLADVAAAMVRDELRRAVAGELTPAAQDEARATHAPLITAEHTRLDFRCNAQTLANLVRGMSPKPGTHTLIRGRRLCVHRARASTERGDAPVGTVKLAEGRIFVQAGDGMLEILCAQLEGRRACEARDLINGRVLRDGDSLGT